MQSYDAIVLGLGGVGGAALLQLAQRGARALGIERFGIAHDRGSSHGHTRIIRQAYFEHPNYVPLALRSYELWAELERRTGERLFHPVGLLQVGPPDGEVVRGVLASAAEHGLEVEQWSPSEIARRHPEFAASPETTGVFEARAGYLEVERCVAAHIGAATALGAEIALGEVVRSWRADGSGVAVETDRATYRAERLIVAAGAWSPELLAGLGIRFEVLRKPLFWFHAKGNAFGAGCPCFLFETPAGEFYGFPALEPFGVKVAEHTGGERVGDPLDVDRELREADALRVQDFARAHLPGLKLEISQHAVCMYTMSPDKHFVLGTHPQDSRVVFAAGLSGHGFKFTPVLGEALAELALTGETALRVGFFSWRRFL